MRPLILLITAFCTLAIVATAFALSIDHETGLNEDGTAKFADPDERQPSLLNTPLTDPSKSKDSSNSTLSLSPNAKFNVQVHRLGPEPQADAFDQAFDHK